MKILMFGWEFPPHISGGLGTSCYGLTKGLIENNVDLVFVVPKTFGDEDTRDFRMISANDTLVNNSRETLVTVKERMTIWEVNSIIVPYLSAEEFERYSYEMASERVEKNKEPESAQFQFSGGYGADLINEVWQYSMVAAEIASHNSFDIIHAHDWLSYPAGIVAKEVSKKPLIIHVHATEVDRSGEHYNKHIFDIEQDGMNAADKIITVSEFTRQIVINRYNIAPEKVYTVHNGINLSEDLPKKAVARPFKEKIVSYLGRITYQKGPDYFIEAANKILQHDNNFRFVMAGKGDMLFQMIKRVAELRISSHFHFIGFLKGDEVDEMFAMSDVYVMPSVSEPFGISPLEAIKLNVPVVISNQSGISEVLNHAIKVNFWDTDEMANAIYALASYRSIADMIVKNSLKEADGLNWKTQAAKVKVIYQDILNNLQ